MKIETLVYNNTQWQSKDGQIISEYLQNVDLVLMFGDTDKIKKKKRFNEARKMYPNAKIIGSSTSGNILDSQVSTFPIVLTAISFKTSIIELSSIKFKESDNIEELSKTLITQLPQKDLKHIFLISNGLMINGSQLARGINKVSNSIPVSGGLAGDGARFENTFVIANSAPVENSLVAIGFYGKDLSISTGCVAGWSEFGTNRIITKSKDNIVYEIDGEPALDLYKKYLGEYSNDLPNSGLRFPLSIKSKNNDNEVIRTLLGINEEEKSLTFAGDIPEGFIVRLMKSNIELLINGASKASKSINIANNKTALGLVVSCVGRKIVMNQLVEDELEAIEDTLGENVQLTGFYSYGELAPFSNEIGKCKLHNQTMTLTVIYED